MKLFATVVSALCAFFALTASGASWLGYLEEPEIPESLMK